jgi:hypothetical protein
MITTQAMIMSYYNQHLKDDFIPLIIEIFICLHQQVNNFFHRFANMAWSMKGFRSFPLVIICSFYRQRVSMALRRIQVAIILHWVIVAIRHASYKIGVFLSFLPHFLAQLVLCY